MNCSAGQLDVVRLMNDTVLCSMLPCVTAALNQCWAVFLREL